MAQTVSNLSLGTKGWVDRINASWRKSAAAIIETGRLLIECKAAVKHGEFTTMVTSQLDFDRTAALRLMQIAGDERLSNPALLRFLPRHFITLHDLRELSDEQIREGVEDGTINKDMRRADVKKLRAPKVTEAEYHEVQETPQGAAVPAEGGSEFARSLAAAEPLSPQDDREGEDSGVTESMHPAATSIEADWQPRASAAVAPAPDGYVTFRVGVDPISRFANGLLMAMTASRELVPSAAARTFPADIPFRWDEFVAFCNWLHLFATAVSSPTVCSDNDQAPRAANAG